MLQVPAIVEYACTNSIIDAINSAKESDVTLVSSSEEHELGSMQGTSDEMIVKNEQSVETSLDEAVLMTTSAS